MMHPTILLAYCGRTALLLGRMPVRNAPRVANQPGPGLARDALAHAAFLETRSLDLLNPAAPGAARFVRQPRAKGSAKG
jgi:hypothetical protein